MATLSDLLRQGYTPPTDSALADPIKEHFRTLPQKFNENQANQMDLLARAYPGNTFKSMMLEGDPAAMGELAMQAPIVGMMAYHGTPHKILGKFDISKMGTGEGNQSYGPGMYFAENPNVAEWYKKELGTEISLGNKPLLKSNKLVGTTKNQDLDEYLRSYDGDVNKVRNALTETINDFTQQGKESLSTYYQNILNKLEKVAPKIKVKDTGNLYKVDIPDEYIPNMLDWDKPLSQQPKSIQTVAKLRLEEIKAMGGNPPADPTGEWLYKALHPQGKESGVGNGPQLAAKRLQEVGVPGIRYLDEFSRSKGKGTSNFVVFEPSTVEILEENAKPVSRKALIEKQVKKLKD